jgi:hypothetical protein
MSTDIQTHGPVVTSIAVWFAMLSPLIGVILGLLGAWLLGHVVA